MSMTSGPRRLGEQAGAEETSVQARGVSSEACPDGSVWLEYAAGLRPEEAEGLLRHAAGCARCAHELKDAMEVLNPPEIDSVMQELASSTPEWQQRMAQSLAAGSAAESRVETLSPSKLVGMPKRKWASWQRYGAMAAGVAVAATLIGFTLRDRRTTGKPPASSVSSSPAVGSSGAVVAFGTRLPGEEEVNAKIILRAMEEDDSLSRAPVADMSPEQKILVAAYNKQRRIELRIPGGKPGPLAPSARGSTGEPPAPSELEQLKGLASEVWEKHPDNPYANRTLGHIALLLNDGEDAKKYLEKAQRIDGKLPGIEGDLAAAWFVQGEKRQNAADYARAAELYLSQLNHDPTDHPAVFHYNLALCYERQKLRQNALDQYKLALSMEKSEDWKQAIRKKIEDLSLQSAIPPADSYEVALKDAAEKLPQWQDGDMAKRDTAKRELTSLAKASSAHKDSWLAQWIGATHTPLSKQADENLAKAVAESKTGKAKESLSDAQSAMELYARAENQPGRLRAQQVEIFALQRLAKGAECIQKANIFLRDRATTAYPVVFGQVLLDHGACASRLGQYAVSQEDYKQALCLGVRDHLPLLQIGAMASIAETLHTLGRPAAGWNEDVAGLALCEKVACPPGPHYALLYNMVTTAQEFSQPHVAAEIMRDALDLARQAPNATSYAYAVEILAALNSDAGDYAASDQGFQQAYALPRSGKSAGKPDLYQAVWQTDQAGVLFRRGDSKASLKLLDESGPTITASEYGPGKIEYYRQLALDQISGATNSSQRDAALESVKDAVHIAELTLPQLKSTDQREQWARESGPVYQDLVYVRLQRGEFEQALRDWERFRGLPYTDRFSTQGGMRGALPRSAKVLVIARIRDQYVGWLASPDRLESLRSLGEAPLGKSALLQQAVTFYRLCADRDSSVADVRASGLALYSALIAPLLPKISAGETLWLDLDASLGMVPFSALVTPAGGWLGETFKVSLLAPWWTLAGAPAWQESPVNRATRATVLNGFAAPGGGDTEAVEVARAFDHAAVIDARSRPPRQVLAALNGAEVFHFSGHAVGGSSSGLVLAGGAEDPVALLTPAMLTPLHLAGMRLAFLAACNTTAADPDQVERLPDLRNSLLLAGAHTVIASNWDVDNESTSALSLAFYKHLLSGEPSSQALAKAQASVRVASGWRHPFYWASFEAFTR